MVAMHENERNAFQCYRRDRAQRDEQVQTQSVERHELQREIVSVRYRHASRTESLFRDLAHQRSPIDIHRSQSAERSLGMDFGR